tara:strand:+ start:1481 stop:2086 length:606 start_codon:yes stop_codon:yes gene_type:complete
MTLATSGTMSIGGTTTDRSINVELGRSATATSNMGETDLRTLAGVASGAISMSNFYGAINYTWVTTITIGTGVLYGQNYYGYGSVGNPSSPTVFGSASDTSCNLYSNNPTFQFYHVNTGFTFLYIRDTVGTPTGNAGWTKVDIYFNQQNTSGTPNVTRTRTNLTYTAQGTYQRYWDMADGSQAGNGSDTFPSQVYATLAFY